MEEHPIRGLGGLLEPNSKTQGEDAGAFDPLGGMVIGETWQTERVRNVERAEEHARRRTPDEREEVESCICAWQPDTAPTSSERDRAVRIYAVVTGSERLRRTIAFGVGKGKRNGYWGHRYEFILGSLSAACNKLGPFQRCWLSARAVSRLV